MPVHMVQIWTKNSLIIQIEESKQLTYVLDMNFFNLTQLSRYYKCKFRKM